MITDFIKRLIGDTLEEYIEDFNASALEWTASDGNLRVKDVKLRRDAFDKLNMPFQLKSGWLGNLSIHLPQLVNLSKDPVKVTLEDVFMVTGPINDFDEEKVLDEDADQTYFYEPLQYFDEAQRHLVIKIVHEKVSG